MSLMDDIQSPTKELQKIIDHPLLFKAKLNIGEEAYTYLNNADNFTEFSIKIAAGLGGSSLAGVAWFATLGPVAKLALLAGFTSTPVGWIAGAGVLSTVFAYGLMKARKKLKDATIITIPKYLNTPLDLLGQTILSLILPATVKMAIIDGCLCENERVAIRDYFVNEWGFNSDFVTNAIREQEALIEGFDYEEYRQLLLATTCTNKEVKYDVIKRELSNLLTDIMHADGVVTPEEERELETLCGILNKSVEEEVSSSFSSILDSIKRRKESLEELINEKFNSDVKPEQQVQASEEFLDDSLSQKLRQLDDDNLRSLLLSGLRFSKEKLKGLDRDELILLCSKELRSAAGSSTRNLFRREHDFPYKQILIDVADRLADGFTPLSWTKYKLGDSHSEQEVEDTILNVFDERARKWWDKLSEKKKTEFSGGLQSVLDGQLDGKFNPSGGVKTILTQQVLDSIFQNGVTLGLTQIAAPGLAGVLGVSIVSHIGWLVLVQTLGFMTGIKIAVFGIGGFVAMGGAISLLGATAVGAVLSIPSTLLAMDGAAYRKTIPTVLMLLAMSRAKSRLRPSGPEQTVAERCL